MGDSGSLVCELLTQTKLMNQTTRNITLYKTVYTLTIFLPMLSSPLTTENCSSDYNTSLPPESTPPSPPLSRWVHLQRITIWPVVDRPEGSAVTSDHHCRRDWDEFVRYNSPEQAEEVIMADKLLHRTEPCSSEGLYSGNSTHGNPHFCYQNQIVDTRALPRFCGLSVEHRVYYVNKHRHLLRFQRWTHCGGVSLIGAGNHHLHVKRNHLRGGTFGVSVSTFGPWRLAHDSSPGKLVPSSSKVDRCIATVSNIDTSPSIAPAFHHVFKGEPLSTIQ